MSGDKSGWKLRIRVWVERDGRKVLGPGRAELMSLIDELKSISAAARKMEMSYRRAWTLVRDINEAAGEDYVAMSTGGTGGGGAELTREGKKALAEYKRVVDRVSKISLNRKD